MRVEQQVAVGSDWSGCEPALPPTPPRLPPQLRPMTCFFDHKAAGRVSQQDFAKSLTLFVFSCDRRMDWRQEEVARPRAGHYSCRASSVPQAHAGDETGSRCVAICDKAGAAPATVSELTDGPRHCANAWEGAARAGQKPALASPETGSKHLPGGPAVGGPDLVLARACPCSFLSSRSASSSIA